MGNTGKAEVSIEAKEKVLASLNKLREIIEEKDRCLAALKLELDNVQSKNCWWDAKPCLNYRQINGFQDAGTLCDGCYRVDQKRFTSILEQIAPCFLDSFADEVRDEVSIDLIEEAWEEISKVIEGIIGDLEDED